MTVRSRQRNRWPRSRLIDDDVSRTNLVAKFPSVTTIRGSISSSFSMSQGVHASISSGMGSRLPGGRHITTFAM
jgi:hypothetical protein